MSSSWFRILAAVALLGGAAWYWQHRAPDAAPVKPPMLEANGTPRSEAGRVVQETARKVEAAGDAYSKKVDQGTEE
jgi:hypothetical protein